MIPKIRGRSDDSCPEGGVFYMCNGFRGCCATDPCMPGSTCPANQNRTPGGSSDVSSLTPITSVLMITVTATTSSITSAITSSTASSTASQSSLDSRSTLSLAEPSLSSITKSPSATATPSANASESTGRAHSSPVGPVVGAVLGTVIFCALLISGLLYVRKRRREKVYKAPAYPSPLVGSDMTPHLSSKASLQFQQKITALHKAESITDLNDPPQLDSREIGRYEHRRNGSIGRFAELPAEPIPWPGTFAHA